MVIKTETEARVTFNHEFMVELNKMANAAHRLAYQKTLETRLNILKASYEAEMITKEDFHKHISMLYADSLRLD